MNGDPSEDGLNPDAWDAPADAAVAKPPEPPFAGDGDAPRAARAVPRPAPGGPSSVRKPPQSNPEGAARAAEPAEPPTVRAPDSITEESVATVRRPAPIEDPGEGPPEIERFLSPPPPPPAAETPAGTEWGAPRRRSRRTVKIPDDAVPAKAKAEPHDEAGATPAPPIAAPVAATPPPPAEKPAALPVIPPTPPVPVIPPRPAPRPTLRSSVDEAQKALAAAEAAPAAPATPAPPAAGPEVIRPMRIISIGTPGDASAPAAAPPAAAPPATDDAAWDEAILRSPSRPPMPAATELEAFVAPPPPPVPAVVPPKPPAVEEVEAIAVEDEPTAEAAPAPAAAPAATPTLRTEEIEALADDDLVALRPSDAPPAVTDDIPVEVEEPPPPVKKPPPPPPKRTPTIETTVSAPPAARADGAVATPPPPPAVTPPPPPSATPPPPPPASAPAAAAAPPASAPASAPASDKPGPALAQTVDLSGGRKRQKPWWEELFSDDYLRTMEKLEPKAVRKECDFIEDRLGLEKGAIMLDLACGAGLHSVELASRGYNVVGYDLSLAMLARAQDEALDRGQKINFLQGDMREMAFDEAFDGIYSWNTSFGYFDDDKNVDVLARVRRGLRQGGLFLLDVANRDYVCPRQPSLVWFEGDGCVCMDEMAVDFFSSRLRVKRTVMFEDGRSREVDYGIRLYALHELGKMLHDTGFKVVEVTGHPAHPGVFFGSESPRIIVLAERA